MSDPADASDPADPTPGARHRHRPARAGVRPRRFWVGVGLLVLGGLVVVTAAWIAVTGLLARSQLQQARADVDRLRSALTAGDLGAAARARDDLAHHAHRAHELTTGPAWSVAADLPGTAPLQSARGIAAAVDQLASGPLDELVDVRTALQPAKLRRSDGSIDVAPISAAAPAVARADAGLVRARDDVRGLPAHTWLGPVDDARSTLLEQLDRLSRSVHDVDVATAVLPRMLGSGGVRRYFVAFQNNAEARGTGGLPGAFAILRVQQGRFTFERFASDSALDGARAGIDPGPEFDQLYGPARSTSLFVNSNLGPDFPSAARIWAAMWRQKTGETLDGAVALDPAALSELLQVTGPAALPDGTSIGAAGVVPATESDLYARYPKDFEARRARLIVIARAVSTHVLESTGSAQPLLEALIRGANERRLLVWSADPQVQQRLAATAVGGALPVTSAPYVGPVVVNDDGTKLDYYLDRSVTWRRTGCGTSRTVTASVRLTNAAPAGLPPSVTTRTDKPPYRVAAGDHRVQLYWFGTAGGVLDSVTVDGQRVGAAAGRQNGHPVFVVDVELPRGASRTVVLHLVEPAGSGAPVVLRQPLVRPLDMQVDDARCG